MNLFLAIFAAFYALEHAVEFGLTRLNLRHVSRHENEVPRCFQGHISLEEYQKSIRYTRDRARLRVYSWLVEIPVFWVLLLAGFFGRVDGWVRDLVSLDILRGLIFLAAMTVLFFLLALPFTLYSSFVIEQRYGFNKITPRLWLVDLIKELSLAILIGGPVLAAVLWFMKHFLHSFWWLWVWLLIGAVELFAAMLYPVLILPVFNKLTPMPEGSLREKIEQVARQLRFQLSGIFVMDGSKRSSHSNAFFAGLGRFRRIVLFDTLINSLGEDELLAVLAHEMGHNIKKHVRTMLGLSMGLALLGMYLLSWIIQEPWFYAAFGFSAPSAYAALFIFAETVGSFTFFVTPLLSAISRRHEYAADRFAAEAVGAVQPMVQGLMKLTTDNLSNLTPHPLYSFFYYSHPTTMERVTALEQLNKPA